MSEAGAEANNGAVFSCRHSLGAAGRDADGGDSAAAAAATTTTTTAPLPPPPQPQRAPTAPATRPTRPTTTTWARWTRRRPTCLRTRPTARGAWTRPASTPTTCTACPTRTSTCRRPPGSCPSPTDSPEPWGDPAATRLCSSSPPSATTWTPPLWRSWRSKTARRGCPRRPQPRTATVGRGPDTRTACRAAASPSSRCSCLATWTRRRWRGVPSATLGGVSCCRSQVSSRTFGSFCCSVGGPPVTS